MPWFKKANVGEFFLNEAHPYSKKRTISFFHVGIVLGALTVLVLIVGSVLEKRDAEVRAQVQVAKEVKANTSVAGARGDAPSSNANQGYTDAYKFGDIVVKVKVLC